MGVSGYKSSSDVLYFILRYHTVQSKGRHEGKTVDDLVKTGGVDSGARKQSSTQYGPDYAGQLSYAEIEELKRNDFTRMADKSISVFPKSQMGGVLGFTYLGENFMGLREDHAGFMRVDQLTQVHEAIHTPDEYETRILSEWMLKREPAKYKR